MDLLRKLSRAGQSKTNACRNLHKLIDHNKILFPVPIDCELIHVAFRRPQYRTDQVYWPILRMEAWVKCLLQEAPEMLLAGHCLQEVSLWQGVFTQFWRNYKLVNSNHCIYQDGLDTKFCVPYFLHGDEGRGYCRRPFMVESFQPCISHKGMDYINESGQLSYNRLFVTFRSAVMH